MPLYAMICTDHRDSAALRAKTRDEHLAYARAEGSGVRLAGALLDEHGQPEGSLLIVECASQAAAEAFAKEDPYARQGLFASVLVRPWRLAVGAVG
jgi:uncharacterized protein YciI